MEIDPWGSDSVEDYSRLFDEFGIEEFDVSDVPEPMELMRRGIIFGERDYDLVKEAMREGEDYAALSGFMPSGSLHLGHLMVLRELVWHQKHGADTYFLIADLEAHSARGMTWEECEKYAREYVLSLLALGFDPEEGTVYRQSENRELQDLAFELGEQTNFNELNAIYGFDGETNIAHMQSTLTQAADILYPQLEKPKPTVIPVGADQDPHLRLTRGLARRMRMFGVTEAYGSFESSENQQEIFKILIEDLGEGIEAEQAADFLESNRENLPLNDYPEETIDAVLRRLHGVEKLYPRVRVLSRDAPSDAFGDLIDRLESHHDFDIKRFDEHVDLAVGDFEYIEELKEEVSEIVREVEVENGGYGFYPPSSIYHRFMTGLTGGKMSSSVPKSHIAVTDEPDEAREKVMSATTGGRETAEEQREKGGRPDECPVYELYAYADESVCDDEHAERVYEECAGGERLCGGCKSEAADMTAEYLEGHQEKRAEAEETVEELDAL
ncbi:MAG: tryptophan--tRNA ligase [Halobacteriales archaeon]|nr:tryptophan--tRNA ligase [Halobacteriales archaeon]